MIIPMQKYSFLVYHKEYEDFLTKMQELGALHVIEKTNDERSDEINRQQQLINHYDSVIKFLANRMPERKDSTPDSDGKVIVEDCLEKQARLTELQQELLVMRKELERIRPWGAFSVKTLAKLREQGLTIRFFTLSKKKYSHDLFTHVDTEIISESLGRIYFVVFQKEHEKIDIDAEEVEMPGCSVDDQEEQVNKIEEQIKDINNLLDDYAITSVALLQRERDALAAGLDYHEVLTNTNSLAGERMHLLEGWIPQTKKSEIDGFLNKQDVLYVVEEASKDDKVPILLKNNKFSKLFEPIGKLFSLPSYAELDLTVFFAPFFLLFFGFCLGDAGYGLIFLLAASLYKLKAKKDLKPILSLVQILGAATILFGVISGTFFGINLINTDIALLTDYKSMFLDSDNMFNLALVLGVVQIVFGMGVKAVNQIRQYGFMHALATFGWLIVILSGGAYALFTNQGVIKANSMILYPILSAGGALIVFFSDVEVGIPARIGKGVWDIYSTVTGVFGDLLSYIRLFALGLSSAILGFVINDIAMQILGAGSIVGPIFFVIFLLLGHGLNIMISSLGSFVHPMRLTFVEFYKNAGFQGGGKAYKPFSKVIKSK